MPIRSTAIALALATALAACADGRAGDPRLTPSVERRLDRAPDAPAPTLPLAPVALATQADFDAFERDALARSTPETVLGVYEALADGAQPGAREADAILLQRLALLSFSASADQARLERTFALADRLHREAPASPHTLYLLAYVKRLLLVSARAGRAGEIPAEHRDVADKLRDDWTRLLAAAPDYVGPYEQSAAGIRRDLAELTAALARPAADPGATPPPPSVAGADATEARSTLWRHEHANPGERKTLCETWLARDADLTPRGEQTRYAELVCAAEVGAPEAGYAALTALVGTPSLADPCAWAARLGTPPAGAADALSAALARAGLPACPAAGP